MRRAWLVILLAVGFPAGMASAQAPETPAAAPQAWAAPKLAEVDAALAEVQQKLAELASAGDEATNGAKPELDRLLGALGRQKVLLDELATATAPSTAADAASNGPIDITELDALRMALASAEGRADGAAARLKDTRRAVEDAAARLAEVQRDARAARETGATGEVSTQVLAYRERFAQADLDAFRLERQVVEHVLETSTAAAAAIEVQIDAAMERVQFSGRSLAERLAASDRAKQELEAQLQRAQGNLDFANERYLAARRKADEIGREAPDVAAELAARTLWREAYRREVDVIGRAIERLAIQREVWQIRFRLVGDSAYATSGEAKDRLEAIKADLERTRRLLESRMEEARGQAARLEGGAPGTAGTPASGDGSGVPGAGGGPSNPADQASVRRWAGESQRATAFLIDVLEQDRRRLDGLSQLVDFALADATQADRFRTLADHVANAWRWVTGAWNAELLVVEDRSITIGKLVIGVALLLAGLWIARIVSRVVGSVLFRRMGLNEGAAAAAQAILFYALLVTIALFALRLINIPLTVFTVLGGALAIGIGFGSQNLMNNFISGLLILAERPIRVGDLIQIGELHGIVQHIGARSTRVLTPNNIDIIVPNSSFLEANVTNWTLTEDRVRTSVIVGVAYGSPTREVIKLMKRAADDHGKVLEKPPPVVLFTDFGDNALVFELIFWIRMKRMMDRRMVESDLRLRINELFREAHITVAFPQRDVHLDGLGPVDVRLLPAADAVESEAD
ncbi:MAG: mechanosensitive ion channel [Phycisphaerales bacterium]|nr:mechanosensitive ion channel [Phycisphaerales bacterium]